MSHSASLAEAFWRHCTAVEAVVLQMSPREGAVAGRKWYLIREHKDQERAEGRS